MYAAVEVDLRDVDGGMEGWWFGRRLDGIRVDRGEHRLGRVASSVHRGPDLLLVGRHVGVWVGV